MADFFPPSYWDSGYWSEGYFQGEAPGSIVAAIAATGSLSGTISSASATQQRDGAGRSRRGQWIRQGQVIGFETPIEAPVAKPKRQRKKKQTLAVLEAALREAQLAEIQAAAEQFEAEEEELNMVFLLAA